MGQNGLSDPGCHPVAGQNHRLDIRAVLAVAPGPSRVEAIDGFDAVVQIGLEDRQLTGKLFRVDIEQLDAPGRVDFWNDWRWGLSSRDCQPSSADVTNGSLYRWEIHQQSSRKTVVEASTHPTLYRSQKHLIRHLDLNVSGEHFLRERFNLVEHLGILFLVEVLVEPSLEDIKDSVDKPCN